MNVLFFASLREQLKHEKISISDFNGETVADVQRRLFAENPTWEEVFNGQKLLCAVNQTLASLETRVDAHDEVAFFPMVTGG
jgi:molybdopterin synthase sulfur carrier subunit